MKNNIKTQRQLRVGQQLKYLISEIILMGDFKNEKLKKTQITVTEVSISPNLKKADVFVISRDNKKSFIKYLNEKKFIFKKEIAEKLYLSVRTIESHRQNILDKTGAKNTVGIVLYAILNNIHPLPPRIRYV